MEEFVGAIKQYAIFNGRATRKDYWMFFLFYLIFYIMLSVIDAALGTMILTLLFSLGLLIPSISIASRRLHDSGRSGWWQLIALIPIIGAIVLIVFLLQRSGDDNEYGVKPNCA